MNGETPADWWLKPATSGKLHYYRTWTPCDENTVSDVFKCVQKRKPWRCLAVNGVVLFGIQVSENPVGNRARSSPPPRGASLK